VLTVRDSFTSPVAIVSLRNRNLGWPAVEGRFEFRLKAF